ncbi:uncharacterized protein LOC115632736 [Scaptodrosophila lebanonensis]|uniref:Uncharacterized protein LOC115632736 n=1 Tax=Drosophila lebanonensis TaxID=7225 RepID=A0A6J2UFG0_DROLE|nr:uncharacterized protein LOC115632736 [Scaptodrosophila lebanonensis]
MHFLTRCLLLCCFLPYMDAGYDMIGPVQNLTALLHARHKRHLTFGNGGSIRLVVGPVFPVALGDKKPWRGILILYNIHLGIYTLPSEPIHPWDKWEEIFARSLQRRIQELDVMQEDETRLYAYIALEHYMDHNQSGGPSVGRRCMLRSICENAQIHHHVGLMAELLNILLTPGKTRIDEEYKEAYAAGLAGVDCLEQYSECPRGQSVFDHFSVDY